MTLNQNPAAKPGRSCAAGGVHSCQRSDALLPVATTCLCRPHLLVSFSVRRPGCGAVALQTLDWADTAALGGARFDALLACDVLYETFSVGPIADLAPRLLFTSGGALLLADPSERTVQNRFECIVCLCSDVWVQSPTFKLLLSTSDGVLLLAGWATAPGHRCVSRAAAGRLAEYGVEVN